MVNTFYTTDGNVGIDFTKVTSTQEHELGSHVIGNKGTEWIYVKATTALSQYDVAWVANDNTAAPITAALAVTPGRVGFAQSAFTVNYYGWVALRGSALTIKVLGSCAKDVPLYTTDTAGSLDDATASASHHQVMGVVLTTTISSTTASTNVAVANFPMIRRPAA